MVLSVHPSPPTLLSSFMPFKYPPKHMQPQQQEKEAEEEAGSMHRKLQRRLGWSQQQQKTREQEKKQQAKRHRTLALMCVYLCVQLLLPTRPFLLNAGSSFSSFWTEQGYLFSWQMKVRHKFSQGDFLLASKTASNSSRIFSPSLYLSPRQVRRMRSVPWMLHAFAHHLQTEVAAKKFGLHDAAVYGRFSSTLNDRPHTPLIDSEVDLIAVPQGPSLSDLLLSFVMVYPPLPPYIIPFHSYLPTGHYDPYVKLSKHD
mmetsp:Transcript_16503/g.32229  ORF Transcript_16503/g.32229 Transcript_16503/m.32229 type:complete len:257 (+) Transcript_16503:334-1104(+)